MFQKFYTDTLGCRYIKSLLANTPIPLFDAVIDGDYLIKNCYYVYKENIIQCTGTGILNSSSQPTATYEIKSSIRNYDIRTHRTFESSTNYYDSDTHYHLGRYLRFLLSTTGLNLLPFYNCYNSTYFSDIELSVTNTLKNTEDKNTRDTEGAQADVAIDRVSSSKYKVVGVPILFGKSYYVAVDCPTQVIMRACIHDNSGFIKESSFIALDKGASSQGVKELRDTLKNSGAVYPYLRFDQPVEFRIDTDNPNAMMLQHNLYLIIQLPANNDSSIVVLENFAKQPRIVCNSDSVRQPSFFNSSLLRGNTRSSYAFSDRLLEYLLGNVVSKEETISQNIEKVQILLSRIFSEYKRSLLNKQHSMGVWDNDIPRLVTSIIDANYKKYELYDQDGNINKDIDKVIRVLGGSN